MKDVEIMHEISSVLEFVDCIYLWFFLMRQ